MATVSGVTDFRGGDTKPTAPAALNMSLYPRSSNAAAPTIANTQWYFGDPSGAEALLAGIPNANLSSASVTLIAGVAAVVFGASIAGAAYRIALASNTDEVVHWESKASTGFTIRSSDSTSTSTVDFIVTQQGAP